MLILFNTAFGTRWTKESDEIDLSESEMLPYIEVQENKEKLEKTAQPSDNQKIKPKTLPKSQTDEEDEIIIKTDLDVSYESQPFDNTFLDKMMEVESTL